MKHEADFERLHMYYRMFPNLSNIENKIIEFGFYNDDRKAIFT